MAKISLKVFKKGKPIYWIVGAVFLFIIFYLMFNKGSGSSGSGGGTQYVNSGPSEALQAAALQSGAQIQAAQIGANVEAVRIQGEQNAAQLGAQVAMAQIGGGREVALATLAYQADAAALNASTNLLINDQNLTYAAESARLASDTQLGLRSLDVGLLVHQLESQESIALAQLGTNERMFTVQSNNLIAQSLINQVGNLKKGDRDNALISLALGAPSSHGSVNGPAVSPGLLH